MKSNSLVMASTYAVPDVTVMCEAIHRRAGLLRRMGAHHVVVYGSVDDDGRVFVTVGLRHREPVSELMRSPDLREWFDIVGVEDIPAVFAGGMVEKIDVRESPGDLPGVVVAVVADVASTDRLVDQVRVNCDGLARAGVRKVWVYGAFDDDREVLMLLEFDDVDQVTRWVSQPGLAVEWLYAAGPVAYPPVFVGTLLDVLDVDATT